MKTTTLLIASLFATATLALAEGIPVDHTTGKVTVPHTIISLTAEQVGETLALGTLTLTSEQEQTVHAKSPQCPKRFNNVLPVTMRDCCCNVQGPYVIALSRDRVAVLHAGDLSAETLRPELFKEYITELRVNQRGEFYVAGQLIPFATLLEAMAAGPINPKRNSDGKLVQKSPEKGSDTDWECYMYVEMPMGAKPTDAVYESSFRKLAAIAEKIGLEHHLFDQDDTETDS